MSLSDLFSQFNSMTLDDYTSSLGHTGRISSDAAGDYQNQFNTLKSDPAAFISSKNPLYMPYAAGTTLDSATTSKGYKQAGLGTIRDALKFHDAGYSDDRFLAPNSEKNPFGIPVYERSDQYDYGKEHLGELEKDQGPMMMALLATLITAGMAAPALAGGGAAAGAGGAMDMGIGLSEVAAGMGAGPGVGGAAAAGGASAFPYTGAMGGIEALPLGEAAAGVGTSAGAAGAGELGGVISAASDIAPGAAGAFDAAGLGTGVDAGVMSSTAGLGAGPTGTIFPSVAGPSVTGSTGNFWADLLQKFLPQTPEAAAKKVGGSLLSNLVPGLLEAVGGKMGNDKIADAMRAAADRADPFARQRPVYQNIMKELLTNKNALSEMPAFGAIMDPAIRQAQAKMAAQGYGQSGNTLHEIARTGTETAARFYLPLLNQVAGAAGANINPAAGAGFDAQAGTADAQGLQSVFGGLGYAATPFLQSVFGESTKKQKPNIINGGSGGGPGITSIFFS